MSAVAGRTITGKVWHVAVWAGYYAEYVPLCGRGRQSPNLPPPLIDLATVPAFGLCQKCERAAEQIAVAVRAVQS